MTQFPVVLSAVLFHLFLWPSALGYLQQKNTHVWHMQLYVPNGDLYNAVESK